MPFCLLLYKLFQSKSPIGSIYGPSFLSFCGLLFLYLSPSLSLILCRFCPFCCHLIYLRGFLFTLIKFMNFLSQSLQSGSSGPWAHSMAIVASYRLKSLGLGHIWIIPFAVAQSGCFPLYTWGWGFLSNIGTGSRVEQQGRAWPTTQRLTDYPLRGCFFFLLHTFSSLISLCTNSLSIFWISSHAKSQLTVFVSTQTPVAWTWVVRRETTRAQRSAS